MPDTPPDPPAGSGPEPDHDEDPRGTQVSEQKPEEQPGAAPGDADGGDD